MGFVKYSTNDSYFDSPQVGDIYTAKVARIKDSGYDNTSVWGLLKLERVHDGLLYCTVSTRAYRNASNLRIVDIKFSEKIVSLPQERMRSLYNQDIISEIDRPDAGEQAPAQDGAER